MIIFLPLLFFVTLSLSEDVERRTIIHVHNLHFVEFKDFATDLKDQDQEITEDEIEERYEMFLVEVEEFQKKQFAVLERLITKHEIKRIYQEGLTPEDVKEFEKLCNLLKNYESTGDDALSQFMDQQYRKDMLLVGNSGKLLMGGYVEEVVPVEDAQLLIDSNPLKTGSFEIDGEANEKREDHIVRTMLASGDKVMILLCGAGHDFRDNVTSETVVEEVKFK